MQHLCVPKARIVMRPPGADALLRFAQDPPGGGGLRNSGEHTLARPDEGVRAYVYRGKAKR